MKTVYIYTNDESREDIEILTCMAEYKIQKIKIEQVQQAAVEETAPTLIVIYEPEKFVNLWEYVQRVESRRTNAYFLLIMEREDFSLAYEASGHYSITLLLQSADKEEWNKRVEMALKRLRFIERVCKERVVLEEYEFQKNHKIMERLLTNILNKPEEVEFLLPEINKRYGTRLEEGDYQVIVINVNQYELCGQSSRFLKEVTLTVMHMLNYAKEIIMGYREPYGLIGIVHYDKETDMIRRKNGYEKLLERIMQMQKHYGEFGVTLSVGRIVNSISKVSISLQEASLAKEYRITTGQSLIYASEISGLQQDMESYLPERKRKELIRYVTLGDIRHVNSWFLEFHQNIEPGFMKYPPAFALFCWQVYCDMSEHEKTSRSEVFPEWKFFSLQHIFDGFERNRKLEVLLLEICHMMAEGMEADQEVAVKAIAYMKVHFREPINLEFIAEKCGLSTSYFSRKFKEQTGENYIDVLTEVRIREAQKLLGTTDLSVMEILEEVGYCDDKHFRKLFHKVTGLKPMEYRKKIRAEKNFD